jgi:uncharacterized membrane protein YkgB
MMDVERSTAKIEVESGCQVIKNVLAKTKLPTMGRRFHLAGHLVARYGAAALLLWTGAMTFIPRESERVEQLLAFSAIMCWDYEVMSACQFSAVLGVVEIVIGLLIALRPMWPMVSAIGSLLAAGMILTALALFFLAHTSEPSLGGFAAIAAPGQFVLRDVVLLGASLSSAGEALVASNLHENES